MNEDGRAENRKVTFWLWILGVVIVASFALSAYAVVQQNNASTVRAADKKAQETAQVAACFQSAKNAPAVIRILSIVDILASNSIKATREALAAAPAGDPLTKIREASLARLVPARKDVRAFIKRTADQAPTMKSCNQLAGRLGVDPSKLNK